MHCDVKKADRWQVANVTPNLAKDNASGIGSIYSLALRIAAIVCIHVTNLLTVIFQHRLDSKTYCFTVLKENF